MGTHLSARYKQVLIAVLDIRTQSCFEEQGRETAKAGGGALTRLAGWVSGEVGELSL